MSQRALGDALGLGKRVGSTRINRYERLASECDLDTAARIANVLGVPSAYFYAVEDDLAELILTFHNLADDQRAEVIAGIRTRLQM